MGFDIFGRAPTTEEGKYFRRNIWHWGPLADLCLSVAPKECSPCREWYTNDGDDLYAVQAVCLAAALESALSDGRVARHIAGLRSVSGGERRHEAGADTMTNAFRMFIRIMKEAAEYSDDVSEEDVREFVAFLKGSGGFEIC